MIVDLIAPRGSNEKIHLNWMLPREISFFFPASLLQRTIKTNVLKFMTHT